MIYDTTYDLKFKLGLGDFNLFYPSTYLPTPSKSDYERGFLTRYLVGKQSDGRIIETNARDYRMTNGTFFIKTKCDWKIAGPRNNIYKGNILETYGVEEHNKLQVNNLKNTLPNIINVLSNYLQFWSGPTIR